MKCKLRLCPECYYDYRAGGIQFDNKKLKVVKVESVNQCDMSFDRGSDICVKKNDICLSSL